jgi:hypothetical protein
VRDGEVGPPAHATPEGRLTRVSERGLATVLGVGVIGFAGVLAVTAFLGHFVRPTSDDYCVAAKERQWGVLRIVHQYYFDLNGRIANAVASGGVYVGGGWVTKAFPGLLLLGLVAGLGGAGYLVCRRVLATSVPLAALAAAFAAVAVTATATWDAYNPYQVIFWAPGSISHTLPSVLAALFLALAVMLRDRLPVLVVAAGLLMGFTVATLSEAFAATGGTLLVVALAYLLVHGPRRGAAMRASAASLAGIAIGVVVLLTSPGAAARRQVAGAGLSVGGAVRRATEVYGTVLREAFNPRLVVTAIAVGVLLALLLPKVALQRRAVLWLGAGALVLPFVMAFEVIAALGVGYGSRGWTFTRAWQDFVIPSVIAFALLGFLLTWLAAEPIRRWLPAERAATVRPVLAVVVGVAAVVGLAWGTTRQAQQQHDVAVKMQHRSESFDRQAAAIAAQRAAGQLVVAYTRQPIGGLAEPFRLTARKDWVAGCAAAYFRVDGITKPGTTEVRPASLVTPP